MDSGARVSMAGISEVTYLDSMSTNQQSDHLIELRHVTRAYPAPGGAFRAIDDLSASLPRGAFVAIVGKSGSGKSTLVNLVAGLDRPSSGEVHVAGTALHELDESRLAGWRGRSVGVVFQSFHLLPTLTVAENVMLPMDFCSTLPPRKARERALWLLEQVGIAEQADKLPATLSGGQQQRAAIARALANDPPLVVADEPTGNLDAQTSDKVLDLLAALAKGGRTVLMVTHERDVSRRVDLVLRLSDGRIVETSSGIREVAHA
jgi:putative ABC transport system ATP-binding protein